MLIKYKKMGICNSSNELKDQQTGVPLDKMIEKSRAICKIILKGTNQDATGFLWKYILLLNAF